MLKEKQNYVRNYNYFYGGFILYAAGYCYSAVDINNYKIAIPFQAIGLILVIISSARLIKFNINNKYLKFLFIIYFVWILFMVVIRGFVFNYQFIKDMLFDAERGMLIYFIPIVLLFPQNLLFYKKLFQAILITGFIFLVYDVVFIHNLLNVQDYFFDVSSTKYTYDYFVKILSVPIGFIILTYSYHNSKIKLFSIFVIAITIIFGIIRARRALIFLSVTPLIIASIFYLTYSKNRSLILSITALIIFFIWIKIPYNPTHNGVGTLMMSRVDEDTRTPVEECFYQDMKLTDWVIGKGIRGTYYCPGIDGNDLTGYRSAIETDYLNIILKGGLISASILLLITIPAVIKGLFDSKNLLSKAAAVWIFFWILSLYPATVFTFSLNYLVVWISIGICYNKRIRNIPEHKLKYYFHNF